MPLANRARAVWGRLPELIGEDLEFVPYGHLRVCYTETQAAVLDRHARDVKPLGLDLELFSAEQMRRRWGIFSPAVVAGSLSPHDGHANPRLATRSASTARASRWGRVGRCDGRAGRHGRDDADREVLARARP